MSGSRVKPSNAQADKAANAKAAAPAGFRIGGELREAREHLGWELGEVAAALRIKLAYLQAIEDGRVAALPGNAYALGFLRTYANTLGLDADEVSRRFRAEAGDVNRRTELAFPAPVPERGVPTGALVLVGLLIAATGYGAWYKLSDREQAPTHTVPPVPDELLPARRAAPVSPQVASVLPPPGSAVPALPPRSVAAPAGVPAPDRAPTTTTNTAAAPPPVSPAPAPVPAAAGGPAAPALVAPTTGVAAAGAPPTVPSATGPSTTGAPPTPVPATAAGGASAGLVLRATAVTWVQVRASDHHVVWDHVMQPGDTWTVPADGAGLTLTTGNAGGLTLSRDGRDLPELGRIGSVRRNMPLDASAVDASATVPAASAPTVTATHAPHRHPALPPPGSADDNADQLNARQLGH